MNKLHEHMQAANGLMPLEVYEALREAGRKRAFKTAVEIGTAHGASAIAFAMGAVSGRPDFRLTTIDPMRGDKRRGEPSSRTKFGSPTDNQAIVEANFERAGLGETISLHVGTSVDFAEAGLIPDEVDALLIDADGRFDRDLILFRDALVEGSLVVIDDIAGGAKVSPDEGDVRWIDYKHLISASLLSAYCEAGLLEETHRVVSTAFCTVRNKERWTREALTQIALEQYRNLVFTRIQRQDLIAWAMAESDHFEDVVVGRRVLKTFGAPIRAMKSLKRRLGRPVRSPTN